MNNILIIIYFLGNLYHKIIFYKILIFLIILKLLINQKMNNKYYYIYNYIIST